MVTLDQQTIMFLKGNVNHLGTAIAVHCKGLGRVLYRIINDDGIYAIVYQSTSYE